MKPILEVKNISKLFTLQHREAYLSFRDKISNILSPSVETEDFWALKDVSFDVQAGESVGIIGRNGAGKSTLLKILSKITPPTKGKIISRGRTASLLEVGTGFHPELTGRENVFFNGSLLGMKKAEIQKRFDEMIDFSGTEKFLDTPLKRYSSGMQLRLAFSVAAFLESEILIIDEILAVGDTEFQKKCLGKIGAVIKGGRTILFVSHNLQAVMSLCSRGIYLEDGEIKDSGEVRHTVKTYLDRYDAVDSDWKNVFNKGTSKADPDFRLLKIFFKQNEIEVFGNIVNGEDLQIEIYYELFSKLIGFRVFVDVCDQLGSVIFRSFHDENIRTRPMMGKGKYLSKITIPANFLGPIAYDFKFSFGIHNVRMLEPTEGISYKVNVEQTGDYNNAYGGQYSAGLICPILRWEIIDDTIA